MMKENEINLCWIILCGKNMEKFRNNPECIFQFNSSVWKDILTIKND